MSLENGRDIIRGVLILTFAAIAYGVDLTLGIALIAFMGVMILQSAFTGWCPADLFLRPMGLKAAKVRCRQNPIGRGFSSSNDLRQPWSLDEFFPVLNDCWVKDYNILERNYAEKTMAPDLSSLPQQRLIVVGLVMIFLLFHCEAVSRQLTLNEEFSEYRWIAEEDALSLDLNELTRLSLARLGAWDQAR
jgi:hypothetical protein